jgi:hypothetical protein
LRLVIRTLPLVSVRSLEDPSLLVNFMTLLAPMETVTISLSGSIVGSSSRCAEMQSEPSLYLLIKQELMTALGSDRWGLT